MWVQLFAKAGKSPVSQTSVHVVGKRCDGGSSSSTADLRSDVTGYSQCCRLGGDVNISGEKHVSMLSDSRTVWLERLQSLHCPLR
jgi:hypothetical protein